MSDLDDKLHDLLYKEAESYYFEGSSSEWFEKECPELIEKFKQAFWDAHYYQVIKHPNAEALMTGQEWYDRFEDTFLATKNPTMNDVDREQVLDAAKRAAGIE